jgi:outer membrane murein-binding lipoprotein Lpp
MSLDSIQLTLDRFLTWPNVFLLLLAILITGILISNAVNSARLGLLSAQVEELLEILDKQARMTNDVKRTVEDGMKTMALNAAARPAARGVQNTGTSASASALLLRQELDSLRTELLSSTEENPTVER